MSSSDCQKKRYGCPFGCISLVNTENHQQVISLKKLYLLENGSKCSYRCVDDYSNTSAACIENQCALVETIDGQNNIRDFIDTHKKNL